MKRLEAVEKYIATVIFDVEKKEGKRCVISSNFTNTGAKFFFLHIGESCNGPFSTWIELLDKVEEYLKEK